MDSEIRNILKTEQFEEFYKSQTDNVREKIDYVFTIMVTQKIVSKQYKKEIENARNIVKSLNEE